MVEKPHLSVTFTLRGLITFGLIEGEGIVGGEGGCCLDPGCSTYMTYMYNI
jgi:hypothetical protein